MQLKISIRIMAMLGCLFLASSAFAAQWEDFIYEESGGTITITGYTGSGGAVTIPDTIEGRSVVRIGAHAFYYNINITGITIPGTVTSIGDWAFDCCLGLTSVTLSEGVISIGTEAFRWCAGVTSLTIPDTVMSIGLGAFFSTGLTSVTLPDSVTSIGWRAFASCVGLTSIDVDSSNPNYSSQDGVLYNKAQTTLIQYPGGKSGVFIIPGNVTSIANSAFMCCTKLTGVTIPDTVTSIGDCAFELCRGLTSVTLPGSVTNIKYGTFYRCTGLTSVTLPDSVTNIGNMAFDNCTVLSAAYFCGNAPGMGVDVFKDCAAGFTIYILPGRQGFTSPFYGYPTIESATFDCPPPAKTTITTTSVEPAIITTTSIEATTTSIYAGPSKTTTTIATSGRLCPAQQVLGEDNSSLEKLYAFRDGPLAQSEVGRRIIHMYYNNADSINAAFDRSPALRAVARKFLEVIVLLMRNKK